MTECTTGVEMSRAYTFSPKLLTAKSAIPHFPHTKLKKFLRPIFYRMLSDHCA